jgi:serine/threonine-protein kinase
MERRLDNRPLKSPKEINRNLSEHLNKAIILGMALEKENRPQSMSDWLQQLELPPPAVEPQYQREKVNPPRSVKPSKEPEAAKAWAKGPDEANAQLIERGRSRADFVVQID